MRRILEYNKNSSDWPHRENENKTTPEQATDGLFDLVAMAIQRVPPSSSRLDSFYYVRTFGVAYLVGGGVKCTAFWLN